MAKLTKQAIIQGKKVRETLTIKEYRNSEVVIRPLTDGELTGIFEVIGNIPLKKDGTPNLNRVDIHKNFKALRMAASMGLEDPKLTSEEVANMKFGVPEYIGMKVNEEDKSNILLDVETQLKWLREIGFDDVDCYWKWRELALLIGIKR